MPRRVVDAEIDGEQYKITQLGAIEGRKLLVRLLKTLAPLIGQLKIDTSKAKSGVVASLMDSQVETFVFPAIANFLSEIDDQLFEELCNKFAANCEVRQMGDGGERWPQLNAANGQVFDDHFSGRYGLMLRWFIKCLAVNGGDFLPGLARMSLPVSEAKTASK